MRLPYTCLAERRGVTMVSRYQKRISGPLLDRIYIHVEVRRVDYEKLSSDPWDFADWGSRAPPCASVWKPPASGSGLASRVRP
jgi:hypothetical protein